MNKPQSFKSAVESSPLEATPATTRSMELMRPGAGTHERGESPWLGHGAAERQPHDADIWQDLERQLITAGVLPTGAIAPATLLTAFMDWSTHLANSPSRQWALLQHAGDAWLDFCSVLCSAARPIEPLPQDKRFREASWQAPPYNVSAEAFLLLQEWWHHATTGVPGVSRHHERMVSFAARQLLDIVAPSNFISLNPLVQERILREGGANLLRGVGHFLEDISRETTDQPPAGAEAFAAGRNLAVTPGNIVLRNRLMELIQYAPSTPTVHPEPVLIVPAWIMKYYVLDLSPSNSLVRYLVDKGFTVFAISWKNPGSEDRDMGMDSYERLGIRAALDAIDKIVPGRRVHAAGYCLGGTLLSTVAAALGRDRRDVLATMTMLAAQTDFSDPGEIGLFVDESQIALLDKVMWKRGYLDKHQMKGAFQMLRSSDLIWSYRLVNYLLGERAPMSDLMAWNADGTRLPYRMHLQYLRGMYMRNALARGEWQVGGAAVNLHDISVPIFNVGAVQDHVAPWRSVFKLHALTDAEQTFVLTAGGHNAGIVNPPGHPRSSYRIRMRTKGERWLTPDEWLERTPQVAGSWWTLWTEWLEEHSTERTSPPTMGAPASGLHPIAPAPGDYVHQR